MKPSILIVDDTPSIRHLLAATCHRYGYSTTLASNTIEAEHHLHHCVCQGVLLDVDLPNESGIAFFKRYILQKSTIPTIFISGRNISELESQFGGVNVPFVEKPFDLMVLLETMLNLFGAP